MFDIAFSAMALITLSPLFLAIAAIMKWKGEGPVFFAHERIGLGGRRFKCLKFRTMVVNGDEILRAHLNANPDARVEYERDHKLRDDPRIIPIIGSFLRKSSLDELPQFINVLIGEMSIVGPRPVVDAELVEYGEVSDDYQKTRPGITGLWQVSGRNELSFAERVSIDKSYVAEWNFFRDVTIVFKTVHVLASSRGAY